MGAQRRYLAGVNPDTDPLRLSGPRPRTYRFAFQPRGLGGRIVGFVLGAIALVLALTFSLVVFVFLAAAAVVGGGWLWWKTRHVRRELRAAQSRVRPGEREVSGEAVIVREDAPAAGTPAPDSVRDPGARS